VEFLLSNERVTAKNGSQYNLGIKKVFSVVTLSIKYKAIHLSFAPPIPVKSLLSTRNEKSPT